MWDYFISHASEDKPAVAQPLAEYLSRAGFKVWYDEFSLKLGDSLLSSIDRGVANSCFGVVILSKHFFQKNWPRNEISGLIATETNSKKILPVWHSINAKDVSAYSPILADRVAINSSKGLQAVAKAIVSASYPRRVNRLAVISDVRSENGRDLYDKAILAYRDLLNSNPQWEDLKAFLSVNSALVVGQDPFGTVVLPSFLITDELNFDYAILYPQGITGPIHIEIVILAPLEQDSIGAVVQSFSTQLGKQGRVSARRPYNDPGGPVFGEFPALTKVGEAILRLARGNNVHFNSSDWWLLEIRVIGGRRERQKMPKQVDLPQIENIRIRISSYDRLADVEQPTLDGD